MNKYKTEVMVGVFVVLTIAATLLLALKVANQTMTCLLYTSPSPRD